jgi:hypothetical protein
MLTAQALGPIPSTRRTKPKQTTENKNNLAKESGLFLNKEDIQIFHKPMKNIPHHCH